MAHLERKNVRVSKPTSRIPVVAPATFTIAGLVAAGQVVGTVRATNSPTSWRVVSGGNGYFAINNGGVMTITANGVVPLNAVTVDTAYQVIVQATNRWGSGTG